MIYPAYLVLFGIILTGLLGLAAGWFDRKVTARVHYRVGPPPLQPLWDLIKLTGKETLVPEGAHRVLFLGVPGVAFAAAALGSTILWVTALGTESGFMGDWIVVLYLLLIPPLAGILGGFASRNPLASLGASREMQLLLGYELPFVLAAMVPVIKTGGQFRLETIISWQQTAGSFAWAPSGLLALMAALLCVQAKLTLVPFDQPEAETELAGGSLIEYSGTALALFRVTRHMLLFALPFLLVILFLGGLGTTPAEWAAAVLKYVVLLAVITVLRNTNPRVRTDQALRFFWGPATVAALAAVGLAAAGY